MIGYITCATALLALAELNTAAAIRSNDYDKRHGLRKLNYIEENDVQTECEQVIEGNPERCVIVCVEVTSVKDGGELVDEYSKVSQRKCEDGWEHDGHDEGHTEWPTYSPTMQFPTYYPTGLDDDGHKTDTEWTGDGYERVVDWTDDGWTSYADESLVLEGSNGGDSGGYWKGSESGYSKSSKSKDGYSKSLKSKGSKGGSRSKSSKAYYVGNPSYNKSAKSSGVGNAGDWDATTLEPAPGEWEGASWTGGAGVIEGHKGSGSSKSSKPESVSWSSGVDAITDGKGSASGFSKSSKLESASWSGGAGANKESNGSGSSKSSKLAGDSDEWESAKWSGGGLIEGGKVSGSSKSAKPTGGSGDVFDEKGSSPKTISDRESGSW